MTVEYKGSDAVERNGVFFSVTNDDHPVSSLASRPYRTMPGTVATVALSVREVSTKYSELDCTRTVQMSTDH